jgi:hypothetical protein
MPLAPSLFCSSSPTLPVQRYSHLSRHIMQSPCVKNRLSATNENVVDGDVDWKIEVSFTAFVELKNPGFNGRKVLTQLDNVANNSHDQEAHADGLGNAQKLALVGCERKTC